MDTFPRCFDGEWQFRAWQRANAATQPRFGFGKAITPTATYCTDCTPIYQAKMIGEQRCAWPTVFFVETGEIGELEGMRP